MANTVIKLSSRFDLILRIHKRDCEHVEKMIKDNEYQYVIEPTPFNGFMQFRVIQVNIRKAELIRLLINNITVYD